MKGSSAAPSVVGMIPARYASTRLPGKVLADIGGKPMVQHVYERAGRAKAVECVLVATDDARVAEAVKAFGGTVVMTSPKHRSGTDRLAEVARGMESDIVVNIQGDEPLIDPAAIDAAVEPLLADRGIGMSTLRTPIRNQAEYEDPAAVQVVVDREGFALYFSRAPIPHFRIDEPAALGAGDVFAHPVSGLAAYRHIGLYVYRRETLLWLSELEPTPLEQTESLEQLRALENGCRIKVVECDHWVMGVDTPEQLEEVRRIVAEEGAR
jgi:3-deoxy-manno-octulosonate cytidylyltransferase (CMP-KDO synthetase)